MTRLVAATMLLPLLTFLGAVAEATSEPPLWQVKGAHTNTPVYLFGALHFGADSFYPLPDRVIDAYNKAQILAVELDTESLPPKASTRVLRRLGQYNDNQSLSNIIEPKLWQRLSHSSETLGMDSRALLRLKPWLAALQLVNLQVSRSDYQSRLGLDAYFLRRAHDKGSKRVEALETLEDQIEIFAGLTDGQQRDFLAHTLKSVEAGDMQLSRLASAWQTGNLQALEEATLGAFTEEAFSRRLYERVFEQRNQAMATKVAHYLENEKRVFLVVGVGHLLGDEGLVAILRERGYRVQRLD